MRTVGALLLGLAVAGVPALSYAQHGGFGGGGGGGGGHSGGGGGGGHFGGGGGGGGHFGGGGGHFFGGGRYGGGRYGGGHYAAGRYGGGRYAASHFGGYGGGRYYGAPHFAGGAVGRTGGNVGAGHGFGPRGYWGNGVGFRGGYWGGRAWVGGYWNGVFWPRCYFNPGFAWFLPILPFGYATYWWGGIPYYYWNDLYYTYNPADNGYVVTEPPPVAGTDAGQAGDASQYDTGADVYLYPRNGQSEAQTATDRYECHSWAVGQTGFDPTRGTGQSGSLEDYRRAMTACLDARGYSAR
ncbi:MAG TPA: hypothetical protein VEU54_06815 [Steroidobacteraceae bacterium]|nr:hypothetical protein [Steroidobacteraceae bacterium]